MAKQHEVGLLIIRLILGIIFVVHGIMKFQMGLGNVVGWFGSIGLPAILAYAVAVIEVAGGISLILGLGTRYAAALLGIVMIGAILKVKLAAGFAGNGQGAGYELDLALFAMAVCLLISGSSLYSLDSLISSSDDTSTAA